MKVTDELAKRVPGEALHVFVDIRIFFRWCVPRYIKHSPMEGLRAPARYIPRKRVLTNVEIADVWKAAEMVGYPFGIAIKLSLLWGTRWGETTSCRRAFIDQQERTITFPVTKKRHAAHHSLWPNYGRPSRNHSAFQQHRFAFSRAGHGKPMEWIGQSEVGA